MYAALGTLEERQDMKIMELKFCITGSIGGGKSYVPKLGLYPLAGKTCGGFTLLQIPLISHSNFFLFLH